MSKAKDPQSRYWCVTLHLDNAGHPTREELIEQLSKTETLAVGQLEKGGETGALHWQLYLNFATPARFSTVKNRFKIGSYRDEDGKRKPIYLGKAPHVEARKGSHSAAYFYCLKDESCADPESRFNLGIPEPEPETGGSQTLEQLHGKVRDGEAVANLLKDSYKALSHVRGLRELEGVIQAETWGNQEREVRVHYLWGAAGIGKTRGVYAKEGYRDVYAPGSYKHPWDNYSGQRVLLLDEFAGQIEFEFLLKLLDRYPLLMPARYSDKWAAFTTVYIVSNLSLEQLYPEVQDDPARQEQWAALLRRLTTYEEMTTPGVARCLLPEILPFQRKAEPVPLTDEEFASFFKSVI